MALSKIKGTVIADDAINADRIADGTVVASDLLDNTLTGAKLATDIAITTSGNITTTGAFTSVGIDDNATSTAITINSSEQVGIGTASQDSLLHLYASSGNLIQKFEGATATFSIRNQSDGSFGHFDHTNSRWLDLRSYSTDTYALFTGGSERMRIDGSGNVGIGTSSPAPDAGSDTVLEIAGSTHPGLLINDTGQASKYGIYAVSADFVMTYGGTAFFRYKPGDSQITSHDNLKIITGTSSGVTPNTIADKLFIDGIGNQGLTIGSGKTSVGSVVFADDGDNDIGKLQYNHNDNSMSFTVNASERMRIDSSGNVGIGLTNPGSFHISGNDLVVGNTTGGHGLTIVASTNDAGSINFGDATSASFRGKITYEHSNDSLAFHTGATERFRVASNGNFCIGTTADPARLNVSTASSGVTPDASADDLFVESSGNTGITIGSGTSNAGNIYFGDSADNDIGSISYDHSNDRINFRTNTQTGFFMQTLTGVTITSSYADIITIPFGGFLIEIGSSNNNASREIWLVLRNGAAYSAATTRLLQRTGNDGPRIYNIRVPADGILEAKLDSGSTITDAKITLFKFGM